MIKMVGSASLGDLGITDRDAEGVSDDSAESLMEMSIKKDIKNHSLPKQSLLSPIIPLHLHTANFWWR